MFSLLYKEFVDIIKKKRICHTMGNKCVGYNVLFSVYV